MIASSIRDVKDPRIPIFFYFILSSPTLSEVLYPTFRASMTSVV